MAGMKQFEVMFEATGFTDDKEILGNEFTQWEAKGFSETMSADGRMPDGVLSVLGGSISEGDGQGEGDIKVFVSARLLVLAESEAAAQAFRPPVEMLTTIADAMAGPEGNCPLDVERNSWEVTMVDAVAQLYPPFYHGGIAAVFEISGSRTSGAIVVAAEGEHVGSIVEIKDGLIGQKIGRDPKEIRWHDVSKFAGRVPVLGEVAEILYANGAAKVKERDLGQAVGR